MVVGKPSKKSQKVTSHPHVHLKNGSLSTLSGMGSRGASSSCHIHHTYTKKNKLNGQVTTHQDMLRSSAIQACQAKEYASFKQQVEEMTTSELAELHALRSIPDDSSRASSIEPMIGVDDILAGTEAAEISHAGGEWVELLAIKDELFGPSTRWIILYALLIAFTKAFFVAGLEEETIGHVWIECNTVQMPSTTRWMPWWMPT